MRRALLNSCTAGVCVRAACIIEQLHCRCVWSVWRQVLNTTEWNPTALYKVLSTFHSSYPPPINTLTPHPPPFTPSIHLLVLSRLQLVCSVVLHFDPSLTVLMWRGMGRLLCRVRQELPESWSVQPVITELCIAMETKCAACVQCAPTAANEVTPLPPPPPPLPLTLTLTYVLQAPSAVFSKLLRVCRFLGTLIVKLSQVGRGRRREEGRWNDDY